MTAAALLTLAGNAQTAPTTNIGKSDITVENKLMTPEALWAMGRIATATASPDGKQIAYQVGYYSVKENKGHQVLCLIDGEQFLEQLSDVATVDRQLAHCHLAIVNKADLIDEEQLGRVLEAIRGVNPRCAVQVCANGAVDFSFLEEDLMALQWAGCEDSLNSPDNKPKTLSLTAPGVVPKEKLEDFLQAVLPQCYRIKGFFLLEDGWNQVDVVGKRIDYKPAPEKEESHLVFLSKVGIQVIRTIDQAWRERVGLPMKLHN